MWSERAKHLGFGLVLGLGLMAVVLGSQQAPQGMAVSQAETPVDRAGEGPVVPIQSDDGEDQDQDEERRPLEAGVLSGLDAELETLADRAHESVVMITSHKELSLPFRAAPGYPSSITVPVTYSGVILDRDGFVLTLADAMEGSKRFQLHLPSGREVPAERWAVDGHSNLGVLRIENAEAHRLAPVAVADSGEARRGQFVMTCGNPFGLQGSTSTGHITGVNRVLRVDGHDHFGILQIDATVNPGDPGGAAFNARGELIGIIWATYGHSGVAGMPGEDGPAGEGLEGLEELEGLEGLDLRDLVERLFPGLDPESEATDEQPEPVTPEELEELWQGWVNQIYRSWAERRSQHAFLNAYGINFVMPSNVALAIADELIEHREVRRAQLGLRVREFADGPLIVEEVIAGSPAAAAGLEVGDRIKQINGEDIRHLAEMQHHLVGAAPGQELYLSIKRNGEIKQYTVTLRAAE